VLNIVGPYTQGAGGAYTVELGGLVPGTEHDQLNVSGLATLGGTMAVSLINGFSPSATDTFTIMTYGTRTGTFTSVQSSPPLPAGVSWQVTYDPNSAVLSLAFDPAVDSDGDGNVNGSDCAPLDATAWALPGEVGGLVLDADKVTLQWTSTAPASGTGTVHDVLRGVIQELPVGGGLSETCIGTTAAAATTDATPPSAGTGFWYLARGRNACGTGTYGFRTGGIERISTVCP
jgi:hypothetical protein